VLKNSREILNQYKSYIKTEQFFPSYNFKEL